MRFREWLNNNSAVTTIGAIVILLISLTIMLWRSGFVGGSSPHTDAYYYDLKTHKLFVAQAGQIPPIDAPSGGKDNGVAAAVFSVTNASGSSHRFIGWLERASDRTKKMLKNDPNPMIGLSDNLIRLPQKGAHWVPENSQQGNMIMRRALASHRKPGVKITRVYP